MIHRFAVLLLAVIVSFTCSDCNNASQGRAFNTQFSLPSYVGPLRIHFALSMTQKDKTEALQSIGEHWFTFVSTFGSPTGNTSREVYVYDVPFLNSPYLANQRGWVNLDQNFRINVVTGDYNLVPDMIHQLVHSYYFPYEIWHQKPSPSFWLLVNTVQQQAVDRLKISRHLPL